MNKVGFQEIDTREVAQNETDTENEPFLHDREENLANMNKIENIYNANATVLSTVLNLLNNIVGAGILSLPHAFKTASIVGGVFLMFVTCLLSMLSMILIAICCEVTGKFSYKSLTKEVLGSRVATIVQLIMLVYTALSGVSFLILIGDFISGNNGMINSFCISTKCRDSKLYHFFSQRYITISFVAVFILTPLSFLPNLHSLRFTSIVSALSTVLLAVFLVHNYLKHPVAKEIEVFNITSGLFEASPIINVAFICHYNAPKYYQELSERNIFKFSLAVLIAFGVCSVLYFTVAFCGYLAIGDDVNGDILTNFSAENDFAIVVRLALTFVVTFTYPFAFNAFRLSTLAVLDNLKLSCLSGKWQFNVVTAVLLVLTVIPSCFIEDITVVLDYKGAAFGGYIGFGLAATLFFSMQQKPEIESYFKRMKLWKASSILLVIWTIVTSVLGLTVTTMKILNS